MIKILINVTICLFIVGCSSNHRSSKILDQKKNKDQIFCKDSKPFGNVNICLPPIDYMKECITDPRIKETIGEFGLKDNIFIAYYVNNKTYQELKTKNDLIFDDYFTIYSVTNALDISISDKDLEDVVSLTMKYLTHQKWEVIKDKVEKNSTFFSVGKPVVLESYSINSKLHTAVMLTKNIVNDEEYISVATLNFLNIKDRLIYIAYYLDYNGEEPIKKAKAKNDYICLVVQEENK